MPAFRALSGGTGEAPSQLGVLGCHSLHGHGVQFRHSHWPGAGNTLKGCLQGVVVSLRKPPTSKNKAFLSRGVYQG